MANNLSWQELLVVGGVNEGGLDENIVGRVTQENLLKALRDAEDKGILSGDSVGMTVLYCGLDGMEAISPDEIAARYRTTLRAVIDNVAFVFRVVRQAIWSAAASEPR